MNMLKDPIELEWEIVNPENKVLQDELDTVAKTFIKDTLLELESPAEFGFRTVPFKDESIFITRNDDTHVFECYAGW